ncbi:MAG TPA: DUF6504 family protein, partial [Intrasporangium sp.]|nr:DUF6504 family protein [Intrasporangium sp.]
MFGTSAVERRIVPGRVLPPRRVSRRRRVVVRRFSDPVEVRVGEPERPEAFIWRGRLYVVRDVLSQWRERRAWWRDALDAEEED